MLSRARVPETTNGARVGGLQECVFDRSPDDRTESQRSRVKSRVPGSMAESSRGGYQTQAILPGTLGCFVSGSVMNEKDRRI